MAVTKPTLDALLEHSVVVVGITCWCSCGSFGAPRVGQPVEEFGGETVRHQRKGVDVFPDEAVGEGREALEGSVRHHRVLAGSQQARQTLDAFRKAGLVGLHLGAQPVWKWNNHDKLLELESVSE